jgi:hypothetical protein
MSPCPAVSQARKVHAPPERQDWPLHPQLALGALDTAVPCARLHARHVLWEWGVPSEARASVELIVSELIMNAIAATRSVGTALPVRFWLFRMENRCSFWYGTLIPIRRCACTPATTQSMAVGSCSLTLSVRNGTGIP